MELKITDVFTPSPKQVENNMFGTVNITVTGDSGVTVVKLMGITVRKDKQGNHFLAMPSYKVGEGKEAKYWNHFMLFPRSDDPAVDADQKERMTKLTDEVLRLLKNGGTKPKAAAASTSKPAAKEPWSI